MNHPGPAVTVRTAREDEYAAVAELTVEVYVGGGFTPADSDYVAQLADADGRARAADLLVAIDPRDGRLLGSVALAVAGGSYAETAGPGEAVFRMLAVHPAARGRGVGAALVQQCLQRAVAAGCTRMVISTQPTMTAAHRLYERMGFARLPEGNWSPRPGVCLWSYARRLDDLPATCPRCGTDERSGDHAPCHQALRLEPPRYCRACGRRMVVQVTPGGWTASCSRHGIRSSGTAGAAAGSGDQAQPA